MKIIAMPSLCDVEDFGLSNIEFNQAKAQKLLRSNPVLQGEPATGLKLYRKGSHTDGTFFVVDESETIIYYRVYTEIRSQPLGPSVTQTSVWRALTGGLPSGFVGGMMLGPLLEEYGILLSDRIQTERGKELWVTTMSIALRSGHEVGLFNMRNNTLHEFSSQDLTRWSSEPSEDNPWSFNSMKHQGLRFFIKKKP